MQMNIFETVKAAVTVRQAAEHYGLKINRSGMICCPFHDDRHPSLKLNEDYFYCFGCGAKGDVIDFVARLLDLSAYEAAQRLAADFGLDRPPSVVAQVKKYRPRVNQSKQDELFCMNVLSGYLHLLEDWKERYAPEAPEDEPDERFVEACHKLEYVEYLNDLLLMSDQEERTDVVYVPVVEKQILWSKRCKDEALRGTVKETIMQVSRSKKWLSKPAVDKDGKPILQVNGKPVLRKSYSVLQDDFFQHMRAAGYTDVERGERDSTEEHLTVTQFKVAKEKQRLEAVTAELNQKEAQLDDTTQAAEKKKQELKSLQAQTKAATGIAVTVQELESMGKKSFTGNIVLTPDECRTLKNYAVSSFAEKAEKLKYQQKYETAKKDAGVWKKRYEKLLEQAQPYLDAVKLAPERVRAFLNAVLTRGKEKQDIPQERGRKRKESTIDR